MNTDELFLEDRASYKFGNMSFFRGKLDTNFANQFS